MGGALHPRVNPKIPRFPKLYKMLLPNLQKVSFIYTLIRNTKLGVPKFIERLKTLKYALTLLPTPLLFKVNESF